ncbi:MAG: hypothetical protein ACXWLR_09510 [Myxococcales bacterium]
MGIGHLAVGFAAKQAALPLAALLLASTLPDVLWSAFLLLGVEHARIVPGITAASPLDLYDYPLSHSLVGVALWTGPVRRRRLRRPPPPRWSRPPASSASGSST